MVTLLTATRNRPVAFDLLQKWIERQTYVGPLQWIVVNDGVTPYNYRLRQDVIIRESKSGEMHSMCMNLLAAVPFITGDKVLIIEDDDYLAPDYVRLLAMWLDEAEMVGSYPAIYFHLGRRLMRNMRNMRHASLGQTAFRKSLIPWFENNLMFGEVEIDLRIWQSCPFQVDLKCNFQQDRSVLHLGMKGLPGEPGIGIGHRLKHGFKDQSFDILRKLIGVDATKFYSEIASDVVRGY